MKDQGFRIRIVDQGLSVQDQGFWIKVEEDFLNKGNESAGIIIYYQGNNDQMITSSNDHAQRSTDKGIGIRDLDDQGSGFIDQGLIQE